MRKTGFQDKSYTSIKTIKSNDTAVYIENGINLIPSAHITYFVWSKAENSRKYVLKLYLSKFSTLFYIKLLFQVASFSLTYERVL